MGRMLLLEERHIFRWGRVTSTVESLDVSPCRSKAIRLASKTYTFCVGNVYVLGTKRICFGVGSFTSHAERLSGGRLTHGRDAWPALIAVETEECKFR